MTHLSAHPYADLFPMASPEDFERLMADIGANGMIEPIVLYQGKILDGRNRYRALVELGVEPSDAVDFDGDDAAALAFVVSKNLARRHLNESQRAMVADNFASLRDGQRKAGAQICAASQDDAARKFSVSRRSVQTARAVKQNAAPEVVKAIEDGNLSLNAAAAIAKLPEHDQRDVMQDARPDRAVKKIARRNQEKALAQKQCALPERKFGVILADPPWSFSTYSENGMDRSAGNHYPTETTDDICALDVPGIAADDAVLFLWATAPMLPDALRVMAAWGFQYKSRCVWAKDKIGTGYWFRDAAEELLVGVRGKVPAPAPGTQWPSLIEAPVGAHSAKPEVFAEMIEAYFPNLPKVELFRRGEPRDGWSVWGNEAGGASQAA